MNVKLVIIGASGVGKTSLRTKYTSGRFSTNYRATIGADFITKAVPHHSNPEDSVQLQIWDTAGQERFSSLATAFFRGADAVILVYDVTDPTSLPSLAKWWDEFRTRAPVEEGREIEFPVAVVGNKIDLIQGKDTGTWTRKHRKMNSSGSIGDDKVVDEAEARAFLQDLIPVPEHLRGAQGEYALPKDTRRDSATSTASKTLLNGSSDIYKSSPSAHPSIPSPIPSASRLRNSSVQDGNSRATSRSRYANGTMTTTAMSIYHTASSSLIDSGPPTPSGRMRDGEIVNGGIFWDPEVEQAIASNSEGVVGEGEIVLDSGYRNVSPAVTPTAEGPPSNKITNGNSLEVPAGSPSSSARRRLTSSNSGSSVQTVTPARLNSNMDIPKAQSGQSASADTAASSKAPQSLSRPPIGPALFFTSAKTGEGLAEVFEYIGARVTKQWEWEESQLHMLDSGGIPGTSGNGDSRIILRDLHDGSDGGRGGRSKSGHAADPWLWLMGKHRHWQGLFYIWNI